MYQRDAVSKLSIETETWIIKSEETTIVRTSELWSELQSGREHRTNLD